MTDIIIRPAWRSQFVLMFVLTLILLGMGALIVEHYRDNVASIYYEYGLYVLSIVGIYTLLIASFRRYSNRLVIGNLMVEQYHGIRGIPSERYSRKVRYGDITVNNTKQGLLDTILGIGRLEIGSAGTSTTEINFNGIKNPERYSTLIQSRMTGGISE